MKTRARQVLKPRWFAVAVGAIALSLSSQARAQLVFDQASGTQSATGVLEFSPGDTVTFVVHNTIPKCFDYNGVPVVKTTKSAAPVAPPSVKTVTWSTTHQRDVTAYTVSVTKKAASGDDCTSPKAGDVSLVDRTWTVPVTTLGWTVGVSAAFTVDRLTDPQFSLKPTTANGTAGYLIEQDRGAQDATTEGLAIFLHLSNTAWSRHPIAWAPISFGVGFKDNTRYFAGTSLQFGEPFFLTIGRVFGKQARLPNGLAVGGFTTNANAITTLGSRTSDAWFLAFSYQFLSTGLQTKLQGLFGGSGSSSPPAVGAKQN